MDGVHNQINLFMINECIMVFVGYFPRCFDAKNNLLEQTVKRLMNGSVIIKDIIEVFLGAGLKQM